MVLGGGTIADLIPREHRGTAMAVWMTGPSKQPLPFHAHCLTDHCSYRTLRWTYYWWLPYGRKRLAMEFLVRRYSRMLFLTLLRSY